MAAFRLTAFLKEARRRRVFRVVALYAVGAWVALQVADLAFPGLGIADSAIRYVWIGAIMGLPVALVFAWRYDIVGGQIIRTPAVDTEADLSIGRADYVVLATLAIVVAVIASGLVAEISGTRVTETAQFPITDINPKSIAVLPFVNMSGNDENAYFSLGITEELLHLLARIPDLKVSSRTSSFHYAGKDLPLKVIAAELGVRNILEGSVRRASNRVRITAQLIDATSDTHLWSGTYDREVLDIFTVQDEIAKAITGELRVNLASTDQPVRPTENEAAYDKFLRGLHFIRQGQTQEAFFRARDYFKAAIDLDPNYSRAHAQLAMSLIALGNFRMLAPDKVYPEAREAASAALKLDHDLPDAYFALGWVALSYEWDWQAAEDAFRRAIELAPNNYMGYYGLAWALPVTGRSDEALAAAQRAHDLDPLLIWTRIALSEIFYKRRDYDAALEQQKAIQEMQSLDAGGAAWMGVIYERMDMPQEAQKYALQAADLAGDDPNLELYVALLHAMLGNEVEARDILGRAEAQLDTQFVSPGLIANVYANLDEKDLAFIWLDRALVAYDSFIFNLDYPDWDPIRSDPRFIEFCDRLSMACAEY
jgi:serine/threonine-protein kinase